MRYTIHKDGRMIESWGHGHTYKHALEFAIRISVYFDKDNPNFESVYYNGEFVVTNIESRRTKRFRVVDGQIQ